MADPADTAADTHDATGHENAGGVDHSGNDAFSAAFEAFASGGKLDPAGDEQANEGDDDADRDGADGEGDDQSPGAGADQDPQAKAPVNTAAGAEESDPWANAPPALIAARDKLVREFEQKVQGASGRASGLQRQLNALKQQPAGATPADSAPKDGSGKKPGDAWTVLDDKIKALKEDYPEIANVLVPLLEAQRDELAEVRGQVAPVIEADQEAYTAAQLQALEGKHSDWRDYTPGKNADFDGWVNSQPENVQRLAGSWDAREVAVALTLFKTERAEAIKKGQGDTPKPNTATDTRRARQMDAGKQVGSRPASAATGAPDEFEGAFEHFARRRK